MAYCTKTEVRAAGTGITSSSSPAATDGLLDSLIESASRFFDLECSVAPGYFEEAAESASNKTFYGNGTNYLQVDPYVTGSLNSTITLPEGYTAPTFTEQGSNEQGRFLVITSNGLISPFNNFYSCGWHGWYSGVPITISARWGFAAVPTDVRQMAIELVINLLRETDPASVKLVNIDNQPIREKCPPRVLEVAKKYRLTQGAVFV